MSSLKLNCTPRRFAAALAFGMKDDVSAGTEHRLLALRAAVAEAIACDAPRRTVACLGAAVAAVIFGAVAPGSHSARACAREAVAEEPTPARRHPRRGRRGQEVVAESEAVGATEPLVKQVVVEKGKMEAEEAEQVAVVREALFPAAAPAALEGQPEEPEQEVAVLEALVPDAALAAATKACAALSQTQMYTGATSETSAEVDLATTVIADVPTQVDEPALAV